MLTNAEGGYLSQYTSYEVVPLRFRVFVCAKEDEEVVEGWSGHHPKEVSQTSKSLAIQCWGFGSSLLVHFLGCARE